MFGLSALYHCFNWPEARRRWLRRIDHAGVYGLIAGTYTPFGLLVLEGHWQTGMLAIVWSGALAAILLKFIWLDAPKGSPPRSGSRSAGSASLMVPQLLDVIGLGGSLLVLARRPRLHGRRARLRVPPPRPLSRPSSASTRSSTCS